MIVTHTRNADGQCRVYRGGTGSLVCWVAPKADGRSWSFHLDDAPTANALSDADRRSWAIHRLMDLAEALGVAPDDLANVPFEAIAALHTVDPFHGRRLPTPRRTALDYGFMAMPPGITKPIGRGRTERDRDPKHRGR